MQIENGKKEFDGFEYCTGLTARYGFLDDVFEIDKQVYSPELCGEVENLYKRYEKCPDSFILMYDNGALVGYISLFPLGDNLYLQMINPDFHKMRDDDIKPSEIEDWRKDAYNNLFVLSIAVIEEYRGGEAVKQLGNKLLEFLRDKEQNGYKIGSIAGSVVSDGGERFMRRFRAEYAKDLEHGYKYYFAGRKNIEELLKNGLLLKNIRK